MLDELKMCSSLVILKLVLLCFRFDNRNGKCTGSGAAAHMLIRSTETISTYARILCCWDWYPRWRADRWDIESDTRKTWRERGDGKGRGLMIGSDGYVIRTLKYINGGSPTHPTEETVIPVEAPRFTSLTD